MEPKELDELLKTNPNLWETYNTILKALYELNPSEIENRLTIKNLDKITELDPKIKMFENGWDEYIIEWSEEKHRLKLSRKPSHGGYLAWGIGLKSGNSFQSIIPNETLKDIKKFIDTIYDLVWEGMHN